MKLRSERADVHSDFPILQSVSSAQVGSQAGRAGEDATAYGFWSWVDILSKAHMPQKIKIQSKYD